MKISKTKKQNIPNSLPFSSQQAIHTLGRNLEKDVEIKRTKKGKGKIIIPFSSDEDFNDLMKKLNS